MKAIQELEKEHQGITVMLRILDAIARAIAIDKQVGTEHLKNIGDFLTIFVDRCHHGKEEQFLFPALEASGVRREGGPIGVMLHEHEQGRAHVVRFKEATAAYISGNKEAGATIRQVIKEYTALLLQHIDKENTVLFPMADNRLTAEKDDELFVAFEQLERERIGAGRHEEFHRLLDRLQTVYLS